MDHSIRLQSFRCLQAHTGLAMLQAACCISKAADTRLFTRWIDS